MDDCCELLDGRRSRRKGLPPGYHVHEIHARLNRDVPFAVFFFFFSCSSSIFFSPYFFEGFFLLLISLGTLFRVLFGGLVFLVGRCVCRPINDATTTHTCPLVISAFVSMQLEDNIKNTVDTHDDCDAKQSTKAASLKEKKNKKKVIFFSEGKEGKIGGGSE